MRHLVAKGIAWKMVRVRVFSPGNKESRVINVRAGGGRAYADSDVDLILDGIANDLGKRFPNHEYQIVDLGQAHFNFVWRGERVRVEGKAERPLVTR